jgi:hypothetical protein
MVFSKLVRPIAGIVALASAPALLAFAVYAQTAPPAPGQAPQAGQISPAQPVPAPAVKAPPGGYNDPAAGSMSSVKMAKSSDRLLV